MTAPLAGGELLTKPLVFDGNSLVLNFSSSAAGDVRVEVQDARGHVIPGYALADCHEVWGDDLARTVKWGDTTDVSKPGRPAGEAALRHQGRRPVLHAIPQGLVPTHRWWLVCGGWSE